jgi:uncharacterized protein
MPAPIIVTPALLLQSEESAWRSPGALALAATGVAAAAAVARWRLWRCPKDALGGLPRDPAVGALALMVALVLGSLGAATAAQYGPADAVYARLLGGVAGNILQLLLFAAFAHSALMVAAGKPEPAQRAISAGLVGAALAIPIVALLAIAVNALLVALGWPPAPEAAHETLRILVERRDPLLTALTLAHVAILVPAAEEAMWRGILQPSMRRAGLGGLASAAATSLLFAAVHWSVIPPEGRPAGLAMLVALSMALGILRERTGSLLAPIALHAAFNALNVAVALASAPANPVSSAP